MQSEIDRNTASVTPLSVLVVGGYGVVGTQVCNLLSQRHPRLKIWVGGRSLVKAERIAQGIKNASAILIDVDNSDPLASLATMPDAIVVAVNDTNDRLLLSAVKRGVAIVDIARWLERIHDAQEVLAGQPLRAPVVLSSGWMAGVASVTAAAFRRLPQPAQQIDIDILFATGDRAGPDSVVGFIDAHHPFTIWSNGERRLVQAMSDGRPVQFSNNQSANCRRVDSPDQMTLVRTGNALGVSTRMAFDNSLMTFIFAKVVRSGLWARLSRNTRIKMLYNPGSGASHEFVITIKEEDTRRILVKHKLGQTHLTAIGTVTQVERLLGLNGRSRPPTGISYPEQADDIHAYIDALRSMGVEIKEV